MQLVRPLAIVILLVLSALDAVANVGKADSATVFILVFQDDDPVGHGSGFFITPRGHLVTNQHVVSAKNARFFVFYEGDSYAEALVVDTSSAKDLALLKADVDGEVPVIALAKQPPEKGDAIFALGFPGSQIVLNGDLDDFLITGSVTATVTDGVVSNFYQLPLVEDGPPAELVQHTAEIREGNSGGPLVNNCGEVVGVNSGGFDFSETTSVGTGHDYFSVASSELIEFLGSNKLASITESACGGASVVESKSVTKVTESGPTTEVQPPKNSFLLSVGGWPALLGGLAVTIALVILILDQRPAKVAVAGVSRSVSSATASTSLTYATLSGAGFDSRGHAFSFAISDRDASGEGCIVGRSREFSDVLIDDDTVSRAHITLRCRGNGNEFEVIDMNSTNHSALNGRRLEPFREAVLKDGDELSVGKIKISISIS